MARFTLERHPIPAKPGAIRACPRKLCSGLYDPARSGVSWAIGRSRDGITTKILALTDALGDLVDFHLLQGRPTTCGVRLH